MSVATAVGLGPLQVHMDDADVHEIMVVGGGDVAMIRDADGWFTGDTFGLSYRAFDVDGPGRTIALVWRTSDPRAGGLTSLAAFFRAHGAAAERAFLSETSRAAYRWS